MKRLLFINTYVRKNSRTGKPARYILEKLDGEVTEVRLDLIGLLPLDEVSLVRRGKLLEAKDFSASEFAAAREFYGIGATRFISAEGPDIIGADEGGILREAMRRFGAQNELEQN